MLSSWGSRAGAVRSGHSGVWLPPTGFQTSAGFDTLATAPAALSGKVRAGYEGNQPEPHGLGVSFKESLAGLRQNRDGPTREPHSSGTHGRDGCAFSTRRRSVTGEGSVTRIRVTKVRV